MAAAASASCYDKAVELLARRAHFRLELARKLASRGFGADEIDTALERLERAGHLDQRRTAEHYLGGRLRRGGLGPRRLLAELLARGVDETTAHEVLEGVTAGETDLAHAAAERWWRGRGRGEPRRRRLAALARHLERAGFNAAAVAEQLRRFEAAGELEGEFDQDLDDGSKLL